MSTYQSDRGVTQQRMGVERSRCAGISAEVDERGGLERTLRIHDKLLVHNFIHIQLSSHSIGDADHHLGSRSRQFLGSNTGIRLGQSCVAPPSNSRHKNHACVFWLAVNRICSWIMNPLLKIRDWSKCFRIVPVGRTSIGRSEAQRTVGSRFNELARGRCALLSQNDGQRRCTNRRRATKLLQQRTSGFTMNFGRPIIPHFPRTPYDPDPRPILYRHR